MASVIPQPEVVVIREGKRPFIFSPETKLVCIFNTTDRDGEGDEERVQKAAQSFVEYTKVLKNGPVKCEISEAKQSEADWTFVGRQKGTIILKQTSAAKGEEKEEKGGKSTKNLVDESYVLDVTDEGILVNAATPRGMFNALQTISQLCEDNDEQGGCVSIPALEIRDRPRFEWRGIHLDVSRHFYDADAVRKYIDTLSLFKFNVFHWHLVDDQGWRIEIDSYPELVTVGAKRAATPIEGDRTQLDGVPYEGHYTKAEVREIVAYAAEKFMTVVPEIEIPGHAQEVIAAYPQFGNFDIPNWENPETRCFWGISEFTFNAEDETLEFLRNVIDEVVELFPGEWFHIGGDEAPTAQWDRSPMAQEAIERLNLANSRELQGYFTAQMGIHLATKGKRLIGWNEILEGRGLPHDAGVMVWNDPSAAIEAVREGHNVVQAPTSHCYFDYYQSQDTANEPEAIGGFLPLERVYELDPIPPGLTPDEEALILGAQAQLWTEYIRTRSHLEYMTFPRALALAEVDWTPTEAKPDFLNFRERLIRQLERLEALGVNFRPLDPLPADVKPKSEGWGEYIVNSVSKLFGY